MAQPAQAEAIGRQVVVAFAPRNDVGGLYYRVTFWCPHANTTEGATVIVQLNDGLSEVSPSTIRKAHAVHPVSAVQSEYSIIERSQENGVLDACEELGVGFVPWGPVCRGFLGDKFNEYSRFSEDPRFASVPYFTPEAIKAHMGLLELVRIWGRKKDATPAQISLAWTMAQKPFIVPIPGTTKLHHVKENQGALNVKFTSEELKEFRDAFSKIELVGVRSPESAMEDR